MTHLRTAFVVASVAISLVVPNNAEANTRKAKRHFKRGETHYRLARFQEALDEYSAAYEAKPLPAFLFNIAQCHMELKNWERAQFFYEGFLRERPKTPNRALVEERIADTKQHLAAAEEAHLIAAEGKRQEEERKRAEADRQQAEEERKAAEARAAEEVAALKTAEVQAAAAREENDAFYGTWWFWTIVGGVAATGAGVAIGLTAGGSSRTVLPSGSIGTIDAR